MAYEGSEKRQYPRTDLELAVNARWGTEHRVGLTNDVSAGGAYLRISDPPEPQTQILVSITMGNEDDPPVVMSGVVVWAISTTSARASAGCGVQWSEARCRRVDILKELLHKTLQVKGGFARAIPDPRKPDEKLYCYTFAVPEEPVPEAPPPGEGHHTSQDTGFANRHRRVSIPTRYKARGKTQQGVIVMVGERRVVVETDGALPSHSDRIEIKASIDSSKGTLPLTIHGQVSRIREPTDDRSGSFWMLISNVDERGRPGLFRQFIRYLSTTED